MLHMSQPSASATLRDVERAFGATLFHRSQQGVTLTREGGVAVVRLRAILGELGMLARELHSTRPVPVLRVGAIEQAFFGVLQKLLYRLLPRIDCRVDLIDGSALSLADRLHRNELDCLLGRMSGAWIDSHSDLDFFYQPLFDLELCVVGAPSHPLSRVRKLEVGDLSDASWIVPREGAISRQVLVNAFNSAGLPPPKIQIETSSFLFTLPLLRATGCLTVAPRDPCLAQQKLGLAKILRVNLPQPLPPVAFVARRSSMENPNVQLLWEEMQKATARRGKGFRPASVRLRATPARG